MRLLIAVATYKRPKGLQNLLEQLVRQMLPEGVECTICVIDNDVSGANFQVVADLQTSHIPIQLVEEPQRGIVAARNRAVQYFLEEHQGDGLIFIDDDEWPDDTEWIANYYKVYQQTKAPIITGLVVTVPEDDKRQWVKAAMGNSFWGTAHLAVVTKFYTNNVFLHREVLETVKPAFHEHFQTTGSEDLHFAVKCQKAGFQAIYADNVNVKELFPNTRSTVTWFLKRGFRNGSGASQAFLLETPALMSYLHCLMMSLVRSVYGLYICSKGVVRRDKGLCINGLMRIASGVGSLAGIFGINYQEYRQTHGQ